MNNTMMNYLFKFVLAHCTYYALFVLMVSAAIWTINLSASSFVSCSTSIPSEIERHATFHYDMVIVSGPISSPDYAYSKKAITQSFHLDLSTLEVDFEDDDVDSSSIDQNTVPHASDTGMGPTNTTSKWDLEGFHIWSNPVSDLGGYIGSTLLDGNFVDLTATIDAPSSVVIDDPRIDRIEVDQGASDDTLFYPSAILVGLVAALLYVLLVQNPNTTPTKITHPTYSTYTQTKIRNTTKSKSTKHKKPIGILETKQEGAEKDELIKKNRLRRPPLIPRHRQQGETDAGTRSQIVADDMDEVNIDSSCALIQSDPLQDDDDDSIESLAYSEDSELLGESILEYEGGDWLVPGDEEDDDDASVELQVLAMESVDVMDLDGEDSDGTATDGLIVEPDIGPRADENINHDDTRDIQSTLGSVMWSSDDGLVRRKSARIARLPPICYRE